MDVRSRFTHLDLSSTERQRISSDIVHLSAEQTRCGDETWTGSDCRDLVGTLTELDTIALVDRWLQTVGQWIIERDDCHPPTGCDYEDYLAVQLGKLIDGRDTDYGFVVSISVPGAIEP